MVTFSEVPDEIALSVDITGCPNHCPGCHSKHLWEDTGNPLTTASLSHLIDDNKGITCVCLMGGDQAPKEIATLLAFVKAAYPKLATCWYSGRSILAEEVLMVHPDYFKVGPYVEEAGPLSSPTTNQLFYADGAKLHKMSAYPGQYYCINDKFVKHYDSNS